MKNLFKQIPYLNIRRSSGKATTILALIMILAGSLFAATYLAFSMQAGLKQVSDRLGADVIVVPKDAKDLYEGAFIAGEPGSFYMGHEVLELVEKHPKVEAAAPQLYLASLQAGCCAFTTQLMAVDFDRDFSVKAWLTEKLDGPLQEGEVIGGRNITTQIGKEVTFYNTDFVIKGKLDSTGMGLDNSVIMNFSDGERLIEKAKELGGAAMDTPSDSISAVMVNISEEHPAKIVKILQELNKQLDPLNARALRANSLVNQSSKQIENNFSVIRWIMIAVWLLGLAVLAILFPLLIKNRSKELAVYRILGASKKQLSQLILKEVSLISIAGALLGTLLSLLIMTQFQTLIAKSLGLPYLPPTSGNYILLAIFVFMVASLLGPLMTLIPLHRFNQKEIAVAAVEND